jgi:hypothetical protein
MEWLKSKWHHSPLSIILWIALLLRLIAAIFSKGYGMHDDHFLVIETAQSWLDGASYNNWFLERNNTDSPTILNFFYAGFHYLLFALFQKIGLTDPQEKMLIVRLIHGAWSLLIVYYGYAIAKKLSDQSTAKMTGLLLAALWLMPFFGVRNLAEFVCIPLLMAGFWLMIKNPGEKGHLKRIFYASLLFGLAFTLRFQTLIFPAGAGLILIFRKQWRECLLLASGTLVVILLTHGMADWIIWGKPFTALQEYISHNINHRFDYTVAPWYLYILVIIGVLIPPVSLFLIAGYINSWKKFALIFVPTLLFIIFHSYYPNKQERFILPALPFIITLGMIGWNDIKTRYPFWQKYPGLTNGSWTFFWAINLVLLFFFTTMYSKKARVESMTYLSKYDDIAVVVSEDIHRPYASMLPLFYLKQWPDILSVTADRPLSELESFLADNPSNSPDFVLFFGEKDLEERTANFQHILPGLVFEAEINPGLPDKVLHWLNPVNANQPILIYRNTARQPDYIE